jgi:hypothetical protein
VQTPAEIKAFAERRYRDVLTAHVNGTASFPLPIPLGTWPAEDLQQMKTASDALRAVGKNATGHGPTIFWNERNTRRFGVQEVPERLEFTTQEDFLRFLKKEAEFARFAEATAHTRELVPALVPWIGRYPHRVIEKIDVWRDVLLVCAHFIRSPLPGCYPREVRLPISTKLIETERPLLRLLLDEVLPETARRDSEDFHERFGLRIDEAAIRFRWLGTPPAGAPVRLSDFSAPTAVLGAESFAPAGVIVVENKTTFLTLPAILPGWLSILGNGNSVVICKGLPWLAGRPLLYWGDIDPAGLQILARLREHWPQTESVMMDRATLDAHTDWLRTSGVVSENFAGSLTETELRLYTQILPTGKGLEQERVLQSWVDAVFEGLRARLGVSGDR